MAPSVAGPARGLGVGQHENLSKVDEIQIADLVLVDVVDQGVARALAIGAPADPLQAVSALGAGRLDGGDVDRRRAGPRRGIRGEAAGAQRLRRTPQGPAPGPLLIHEQSWECLALKMARRINSLGLIEAPANAMCLHGISEDISYDNGLEMIAKALRWFGRGSPLFEFCARKRNGRNPP